MRRVFPLLLLNLDTNRINNTIKDYDFLINPFIKFLFKYFLKNFNFTTKDL